MNDHLVALAADGDPRAVAWLVQSARAVVAAGGAIGLERAAGLANTPAQRRRALRDFHVVVAARALGVDGALAPQLTLHKAFEDFRRACWPLWSARKAPPESASAAEIAMHHAMRAGDVPRSPQGLGRIVRSWRETHRAYSVAETG